VARRPKLAAATVAIAFLAGSACSAPPEATGGLVLAHEDPRPTRALLAPGDLIRIDVYGHPELSSSEVGQLVDFEGKVHLPLFGSVSVSGLSVEAAIQQVESAGDGILRDPSVAISVIEYGPRWVYVLGAVTVAGRYDMDSSLPALQALALAGGFRRGADREQVAVLGMRGDELEVRFFNAASPGVDGMFNVGPGDLIFVRQSGTGTFSEQILPYIQAVTGPIAAAASLVVVSDNLSD
jgi:protein involved in polysaccharide export with SLBB domain